MIDLPDGKRRDQADRAISKAQLHALPRFHTPPIDGMVYPGSMGSVCFEGGFPLRCFQRWLITGFGVVGGRLVGGSWRRSVVMMDMPEDRSCDLGCSPLSAGRSRPRWMP